MVHHGSRLFFALALVAMASPVTHAESRAAAGVKLPHTVSFVVNRGQAPPDVLWVAEGQGFQALFRRDGFTARIGQDPGSGARESRFGGPGLSENAAGRRVIEQGLSWLSTNASGRVEGLDAQPGKINYFLGNDPAGWVRGLASYARLRYTNLYPGIDLIFYGNGGSLEYDLVVKPGADPNRIRLRVEGDAHARITDRGELQVGEGRDAVLHRPLLYQNVGNGKRLIEGKFVHMAKDVVAFRFADYDSSKTLVIDPTLNLLYSTYLGGVHDDVAGGMVLDANNNAYIVGQSASQDYPISGNAFQTTRGGVGYIYNAVVTKISPAGILLYSTFLGGSTGENGNSIGVDEQGDAYITGMTKSTDFPITSNGYQTTYPAGASNSAFLAELSPDGSTLLYSSFFGGSGGATGYAVRVRSPNSVYLAGTAGVGLPVSSNAYLGQITSGSAAFVAIFNPATSGAAQLVASSYYGAANPTANDSATGNIALSVAWDSAGDPWIAGQTYTNNLPTTGGAIQATLPALSPTCATGGAPLNSAAFVAHLSSDLSSLSYASYLSGRNTGTQVNSACSEYAHNIAIDADGNVYVGGVTASSTFPVTAGVLQGSYPGDNSYTQFVAKLSPAGALTWSTYLGGNGGYSFLATLILDAQNDIWVGGLTAGGSNFPISQNAFQSTVKGPTDGYITELNNDGTQALYSTYLGGSGDDTVDALAIDPQNNIFAAGHTDSTNFPVTSNAFQSVFANGNPTPDHNDIFFTVLGSGVIGAVSPASVGNTGGVTVSINGAGFQQGGTCSLSMGNTIIQATNVVVGSSGNTASCTFALNGAATGAYDVSIKNPDGTGSTDKAALNVVSGGQPSVWVNLAGRSKIRVNTPATLYLNYGNNGTIDAYMTTLWLVIPTSFTYSVSGLQLPSSVSTFPIGYTQGDFIYIPILVPIIPAGSSSTLPVKITAPNVGPGQDMAAYAEAPWFDSSSAANQAFNSAISSPGSVPSTCPSTGNFSNCLGKMASIIQTSIGSYLTQVGISDPSLANDTIAQLATEAQKAVTQALSSQSSRTPEPLGLFFDVLTADLEARVCGAHCSPPNYPFLRGLRWIGSGGGGGGVEIDCPDIDSIGFGADFLDGMDPCFPEDPEDSVDPNDKRGPNGDSSASHYVKPVSPFNYFIGFENQATATLPAAQVVVTDQLDPTKVDVTTITLGAIAFGTNIVPVPAGTSNFDTTYSISSSLSVRIQGSFDSTTNTLKWTFTSIDPSTGLPPSDPTAGFLPPDTDGVRGQGSVTFTVEPKTGLAGGTHITNQATVVFDQNPPIETPIWLNTIAGVASVFTNVPGSLTQISVGADGSVWGLNSSQQIFMYDAATSSWTSVPGALTEIAVGTGGNVWGLNAQNEIFYRNSANNGWVQVPGLLSQIAVGADGDTWGINSQSSIYHYNPQIRSFSQVPGDLVQISVGSVGAVYGVNSAGSIYWYNPGIDYFQWVAKSIGFTQVSVSANGDVWAVRNNIAYHYDVLHNTMDATGGANISQVIVAASNAVFGLDAFGNIFQWSPASQSWVQIPGDLSRIAAGGTGVAWGINGSQQIYDVSGAFTNAYQTLNSISGSLSQISVGADGSVWGIDSNTVEYFNLGTQSFQAVAGAPALAKISVGTATSVWGLDASGNIFQYDAASGSWTSIAGQLKTIQVAANGDVWGLNAAGSTYSYNTGQSTWTQIPGTLVQLSVGADGAVWGINAGQQIYRYDSLSESWVNVPGSLVQIAVGNATNIWGVNYQQKVYRYDTTKQQWVNIPGAYLVQISVGFDGSVWGVNPQGSLYQWSSSGQSFNYIASGVTSVSVANDATVWALNMTSGAVYSWF